MGIETHLLHDFYTFEGWVIHLVYRVSEKRKIAGSVFWSELEEGFVRGGYSIVLARLNQRIREMQYAIDREETT